MCSDRYYIFKSLRYIFKILKYIKWLGVLNYVSV